MTRLALALLIATAPACGATLRPYAELHATAVHLSDLFAELGRTPDALLGPGPAPGERIVVGAAQLAAIARDYGVDWRPGSGTERAILARAGVPLPRAPVEAALREAVRAAGAPPGADIEMRDYDPPLVADAADIRLAVTRVDYDAASSRFSALLSVAQPDAPPLQFAAHGEASVMQTAAVLLRPLPIGATIAPGDVEDRRIAAHALAGHTPLAAATVTGQVLRRARSPGVPLIEGDATAPQAVARGGTVRLSLDAGTISLTAQAVALDQGGIGDRIRAQNPSSRAIVEAVVTGAGTARVLPGALAISLAAAQ